MAAVRGHQDAVFNRTGRVEIPSSHIRRQMQPSRISFLGLFSGGWSELLEPDTLSHALLYVDIHSLLLTQRTTVSNPATAFEKSWEGVDISVPAELTSGDYRVKLQITIALPEDNPDSGRILARSSEIVIVQGPDDGGNDGPSLLKVRPSLDPMSDLSRLEISETEGPILYINKSIPGLSWKELASDPVFKHGIFSTCLREILRHLVIKADSQSSWGAAWLALKGIKGLDVPDVEDLSVQDAWDEAHDFAESACEHLLEQVELTKRFAEAIARREK